MNTRDYLAAAFLPLNAWDLAGTDAATTEIYTLSLHDALPILTNASTSSGVGGRPVRSKVTRRTRVTRSASGARARPFSSSLGLRSEEHTSELQSRGHLVCCLLLEVKDVFENQNVLTKMQLAIQ